MNAADKDGQTHLIVVVMRLTYTTAGRPMGLNDGKKLMKMQILGENFFSYTNSPITDLTWDKCECDGIRAELNLIKK